MRQVTLDEVYQLASDARQAIWDVASQYGREPKIYLHWSAGRYDTCFDDFQQKMEIWSVYDKLYSKSDNAVTIFENKLARGKRCLTQQQRVLNGIVAVVL